MGGILCGAETLPGYLFELALSEIFKMGAVSICRSLQPGPAAAENVNDSNDFVEFLVPDYTSPVALFIFFICYSVKKNVHR